MTGCLVKSGSQAPVSLLEIGHTCKQMSMNGMYKEYKHCFFCCFHSISRVLAGAAVAMFHLALYL